MPKTIGVILTAHSDPLAKKEIKVLKSNARKGMSVAIEIDPLMLREMFKLLKNPNFDLKRFLESIKREVPLAEFPGLSFSFHVVSFCWQKGLRVIPIDSHIAVMSLHKFDLKRRDFIAWPMRESVWVKRINKAKPDFLLIGATHFNGIVNKIKLKTRVLFKPPPTIELVVKNFLAEDARNAFAAKLQKRKKRKKSSVPRKPRKRRK